MPKVWHEEIYDPDYNTFGFIMAGIGLAMLSENTDTAQYFVFHVLVILWSEMGLKLQKVEKPWFRVYIEQDRWTAQVWFNTYSISHIVTPCISVVLTLKEPPWDWLSSGHFAQVTQLE